VSAGGRLLKDKTFFFGNYEGRRRITGVILQGLVPTDAMKSGDFIGSGKIVRDPLNSNQPFPGISYWLQATRNAATSSLEGSITEFPISRPCSAVTLLPTTNSLTSRIFRKGLVRPDNTHHLSIGLTHLFTPNVIGESRLVFSRAFLARQSDGDRTSTNYAAELGLKNLAPNPGEYTLPSVNLTGYAPGNPTGTSGLVG
jgi:hypothetical protein